MMEVLLDTTAFNEISIKKETCLHIKVASSNNSNNSDSTLDTTISPCDIERKDDIVDTPFDDALNSPTEEICSQPVLNEEIFNKKIEISPVYAEALTTFTPIQENEYKRGASGKLPKDFMPCCCKFDEGKDDAGLACGEESDCINRALLIECTDDDCPLRSACQNRRFQNKEYAPIEVIKTEKKGYGIRAMENLRSNEFVIEYCGEVIPQSNFVKRTKEYSKSGVKHFYFMSLNGDDLIDAQKKGNISRFLNHSCAPNCMIQKWVVNSRMRMGIFTLRKIAAGEELTFDYKFDRYGKEAQPCYCGEPNCNGFIGGGNKTADSDDDEEEDVVEMDAKKPKRPKKEAKVKALENIEHVKTLVKKMLYSTKLPSQVTKLLRRLEVTDNLAMRKCFVKFHGLLVLKSCLTLYSRTDLSLCYQILKTIKDLPLTSRNAIVDYKIDEVVTKLLEVKDAPDVVEIAKELLAFWETLPLIYKIPKLTKIENPTNKRLSEDNRVDSDREKKFRHEDRRDSSRDSGDDRSKNYSRDRYDKYDYRGSRSFNSSSWKSRSYYNSFSRRFNESYSYSGSNSNSNEVQSNISETTENCWAKAFSDEGKPYYYHTSTNETTWDRPEGYQSPGGDNQNGDDQISNKTELKSITQVSQAELDDILKEEIARAEKLKLEELKKKDVVKSTNGKHGSVKLSSNSESSHRSKTVDPKKLEVKFKKLVSEVVIKTLSKYKADINSSDAFKEVARKYTHSIAEKEIRSLKPGDVLPAVVGDDIKRKIKKFVYSKLTEQGYIKKGKKTTSIDDTNIQIDKYDNKQDDISKECIDSYSNDKISTINNTNSPLPDLITPSTDNTLNNESTDKNDEDDMDLSDY